MIVSATLKFNSGMLAILCSTCSKILKVGSEFNKEESDYASGKTGYLPPYYCKTCSVSLTTHSNDSDG